VHATNILKSLDDGPVFLAKTTIGSFPSLPSKPPSLKHGLADEDIDEGHVCPFNLFTESSIATQMSQSGERFEVPV